MKKSISQSSSTKLLMRMYHGRADVNEVMEDWGSEGPMLEHIAFVRYEQGALMLEFDESQHAQVARNLTGWQVFRPYGSNPCYLWAHSFKKNCTAHL